MFTCMGKLTLLSNIACAFLIYHPFWVFSPPIQWCLECDQTFQFTPCAPHHIGITTLIIPTQQRLHNCCVWNPQNALASNLGKKVLSLFSIHGANRTFFFRNVFAKFGLPCHLIPKLHHFHGPMCLVLLWIKDFKPSHQIICCIWDLTIKPFQKPCWIQ